MSVLRLRASLPAGGGCGLDARGHGGKARQLLELQAAGFPVPEFVCSPPDLEAAVEALGFPVAVRSSASAEDGREHSFAGQFKSFLDLRSLDEVEAAMQQCRDSVRAPSVGEYCRKNGVDPNSLRMDVIVQRMVRPELAGVAFTVNPVTGAETVVIEACEGLGDALIAGRQSALSPDHPHLRRHVPAITRVARAIHRHFGAPQDIEFAIENGTLFILQARPITRLSFAADVGEWTNADFRDGGVSSGVCTPLMWSLYDFIWEDALKQFLREIRLFDGDFQAGRMFFGRPYWNLGAVKKCLSKLPGFVEREFDEDLGIEPCYEGDGMRTPVTLWRILRAMPTALAVQSMWRQQERFDRAFLDYGFATLVRRYETIPPNVELAFESLIKDAYRLTETNYFRTIYGASLAKLDFLESFPEADYAALVAGLPPLRHFECLRSLEQVKSGGNGDVASVVERFRHHSRRELDIREPRWDEEPGWAGELLERCAGGITRDSGMLYHEARAAALARMPARRQRRFLRKLERLRLFLWLREEMRDLSSRVYYLLRRHVLEIARRRGLGDDVFFMSWREILRDDRSHVARGRETYDSFRNFKAPNEIGQRHAFDAAAPGGALRGIGASHGSARGRAHLARTVEEAMHAEEGSILVCPFTDPGWTPVLGRVAAVVTEHGGLLSHASVICREFGIPAVLGVRAVTERIVQGSLIAVDGARGIVEIISAA